MQAQIPREPLLAALQVAHSVIGGGGADRTVVQDVRLTATADGITLRTTDYELGIRLQVPESEVMEPGEVVVPVARLIKILRESEAPAVRCTTDDAHLKLELPGAKYTVHGVPPEEFPEFPEPEASGGVELPAGALREMIRRTQFAAATERSRYTLNGVRWEGHRGVLRLVATDGRRLALTEHKTTGGAAAKAIPPAIVPLKATAVLEKMLAGMADDTIVTCKVVENRLAVSAGATHFSALLLEGQYPDYQGVIREPGERPLAIEPSGLLKALRQAMPLTEDESRAVKVTFTTGQATLTARLSGSGGGDAEVEVELPYTGKPLTSAFDSVYLRDALRVLGTAATELDVTSASAAAVLRTVDGYINVVMPITLPDGA
jgi:DNA polymerase III subunit beta